MTTPPSPISRRTCSARPVADARDDLREEVDVWFPPYHLLMQQVVADAVWGVGRADAVSMIFNRVAGLDIGGPSTRIIESNIARPMRRCAIPSSGTRRCRT